MKHLTGNILSPVEDRSHTVFVINPVDINGVPNTELQIQILNEFPLISQHWSYLCKKYRKEPELHEDAHVTTVYFSTEETHGFFIADCMFPNMSAITPDQLKACLEDICGKGYDDADDGDTIRIPYKMGLGDTNMSDAWWTEIIEMLMTTFPALNFEIWR